MTLEPGTKATLTGMGGGPCEVTSDAARPGYARVLVLATQRRRTVPLSRLRITPERADEQADDAGRCPLTSSGPCWRSLEESMGDLDLDPIKARLAACDPRPGTSESSETP